MCVGRAVLLQVMKRCLLQALIDEDKLLSRLEMLENQLHIYSKVCLLSGLCVLVLSEVDSLTSVFGFFGD